MRWSPGHLPMGPALVLTLLGPTCLGCNIATSDALAEKARSACLQVMGQDAEFARYGLTVAARSDSPFARQVLLDSLMSQDYRTALEAAKGLAEDPDPGTEQALQQVFSTKEGALQLAAATALARLGDRQALDWLKGQVDKASGAAQLAVIVFLSRQGEEDLVLPIIRRKMDSDLQDVRDEAYGILGEIQQPWATELLLQGLDKEHGENRKQAVISLGRTGDPAVAPELTRFVNTRGLVFPTLEALGELGNPEAKPALEDMLHKGEPLVQVYAATGLWKLGSLGNPESVLGPLVTHRDATTRLNLAEQLASVKDKLALSMLLTLAEDEDAKVRAAAVKAIADRGEQGTVAALLQRAEDPDYTVATRALGALGRLADSEAAGRLKSLLESENPYVVISAANAILEIKARRETTSGG